MRRAGFTLIELLVVIAIIAMLSTLSVVSLNSARVRSRDTRRLADVRQIQTALEMYASNKSDGQYPIAEMATSIDGFCLGSEGFASSCASLIFMKKIPNDPRPNTNHYVYSSDGMSYNINYWLEDKIGSSGPGKATATPGSIQ
ncbi:MAG TPA: type II secretion system protein [bacterium]|nr:type II secretion system protein [bacterium]